MSKTTQLKKKAKLEQQTPKEQPLNISEAELVMDILTGDINWNDISKKKLNLNFVKEYQNYLNWMIISAKVDMPKEYFELFTDKLDWRIICSNHQMRPTFIRKYKDYMHWDVVARCGYITNEIFEEFFEELYCSNGLINMFSNNNCSVSDDVLDKYTTYFNNDIWKSISGYLKLTEKFIDKYAQKLNWNRLSESKIFTQDQIKKYKNLIKWNDINRYAIWRCDKSFITEEILPLITNGSIITNFMEFGCITEYNLENLQNPNVWKDISYFAKLSEDFIRRHKHQINKHGIASNSNISDDIKLKLKKEGII